MTIRKWGSGEFTMRAKRCYQKYIYIWLVKKAPANFDANASWRRSPVKIELPQSPLPTHSTAKKNYIPGGHGWGLHVLVWSSTVVYETFPWATLTLRCRCWTPPPHVTEHLSHSVHCSYTRREKKGRGRWENLRYLLINEEEKMHPIFSFKVL